MSIANIGFAVMMGLVLVLTFLTRDDNPNQFRYALLVVAIATFGYMYLTGQMPHFSF